MSKILFTVILATISLGPLWCQTRVIDSLHHQLTVSSPKEQAIVYLNIIFFYERNRPDSAEFYAEKLVQLGREIGEPGYITMSLNTKAGVFLSRGKEKMAFNMLHEVMALSIANDFHEDFAVASRTLGEYYHRKSANDSALYYYILAGEAFEKTKNQRGKAVVIFSIAKVNHEMGDYGDALARFYTTLNDFEDLIDQSEKGIVYYSIGEVYYDMRNYEKAIELYNSAIEISKAQLDNLNLCASYRLLGKAHLKREDFQEADKNLKMALSLAETLEDNFELASCLLEMARLNFYTDNQEGTLFYLNKTNALLQKNNNIEIESQIYFYKGKINYDRKELKKAENNYLTALRKAKSIKADKVIIAINKELSDFYRKMGDPNLANYYTVRHLQLKDSLINDNLFAAVIAQEKYEAEKREREKAEVEAEIERTNFNKERRRNQAYVIFAAIIAVIIISFYLYYRIKRRALVAVHKVKEEMNEQKVLNLIREKEIEAIKFRFEGQENERNKLAMELHDNIGGMLGSLTLLLSARKKPSYHLLLEKTDNIYKTVREMSKELLPLSSQNMSYIQLEEKYLADIRRDHKREVNFEYYPEEEINAVSEWITTHIYFIIMELTSNALIHGEALKIDVQLTMHEKDINLMVSDNGKGFDVKIAPTGIGLKNIDTRMKLLDGVYEINSSPGNGTVAVFDIPCNRLVDDEASD